MIPAISPNVLLPASKAWPGGCHGKQTETLAYPDGGTLYPRGIHGLEGTPGDVIPRYRSKRYEWKIGETTGDTEQTLAVARAILKDRNIAHSSIGKELLKCVKCVHPGVSMWSFVQAGDASRIACDGDGCGAAMRVSPVGVLSRSTEMDIISRSRKHSPDRRQHRWRFGQRSVHWFGAIAAAFRPETVNERWFDVVDGKSGGCSGCRP
jgi:ADP-ribosylglycohydrolase